MALDGLGSWNPVARATAGGENRSMFLKNRRMIPKRNWRIAKDHRDCPLSSWGPINAKFMVTASECWWKGHGGSEFRGDTVQHSSDPCVTKLIVTDVGSLRHTGAHCNRLQLGLSSSRPDHCWLLHLQPHQHVDPEVICGLYRYSGCKQPNLKLWYGVMLSHWQGLSLAIPT